jgi:poly(3-hydroxybutyrate) depolymerase
MRTVDRRRKSLLIFTLLFLALAAGALVVSRRRLISEPYVSPAVRSQTGPTRIVQTATSTGRHGAYYLPRDYQSRALPVLVFLHGTGGKGSRMILRLSALAEREDFIAIAPDSVNVTGVWLADQGTGGVTEDRRHVLDCLREVLTLPRVRADRAQILIAGFSVGGGAAASIASHEDLFTAFAVLHGHVALDAMGPRRVRGWLSAGDRDRLRTVEQIRSLANRLRAEGFPEVDMQEFRADHTLGEQELATLVAWWLRRPPAISAGTAGSR